MAFGSEVDQRVWLERTQQFLRQFTVADVSLHEAVTRRFLYGRQIGQVSGIGKNVQHQDFMA